MSEEMNRQIVAQLTGFRVDADETAFASRELEKIKEQTYDVKYSRLKGAEFVPPDTSIPDGAESVTYSQYDGVGMAKIISTVADDLPAVDVLKKQFTLPVVSLGASYSYSIQDLRNSAMAGGRPLDQRRAATARRAIDQLMDTLIATGDSNVGFEGFANNSNVTPLSATGNWASGGATALQILADMHRMANSVVEGSKEVFEPDTLVMPTEQFNYISSTPMTGDNTRSILETFLAQSTYVTTVRPWNKLDGAGAGGADRAVCYLRDPEVLVANVPVMFEQLPPQARNLQFVVNCHARFGGVEVHYPVAMSYLDGI